MRTGQLWAVFLHFFVQDNRGFFSPPRPKMLLYYFILPPRPHSSLALFELGQGGQHERDAKSQFEGHVVLDRRPQIDPFNVSLDPGRGDDVVAFGGCKL